MAIKDLKIRDGNVDIVLDIFEKGDVREFQKFGKNGRVCNAKARDESGEITITLWNDDIDKVKVGDKIHIKNGYVSEWQGEPQLGTGRFGEIEVVGAGSSAAKETKDSPSESKKDVEEDILDDVEEENVE